MKAWEFTGPGEPLRAVERPTPSPGQGEVLVRVGAAGLCHSDVGFLDGTLSHVLSHTPIVLGHEVAGTVVEVGTGVTGFEPGTRVALFSAPTDSPGITRDGGFGDHVLSPADRLIPVPDGVNLAQAAVATDAGMTSHNAVIGNGAVRPGDRVGVIGLGGLGLTGARIAVLAGATVHAVEPKREIWEAARQRGVTSVVADVSELAGTDLDVVIDFAGYASTTAGAVEAARPGGRVVLVGLGQPEVGFAVLSFISKSLTMIGSSTGSRADVEAVLEHIAAGRLEIAAQPIAVEDIPAGLDRLAAGTVTGRLVAEYPAG